MAVDTQQLKRRFARAKEARSNVEGAWDDVERFVMPLSGPRRKSSTDAEGSVEWKRPDVWDFTAVDGARKLAASIHGSLTPPSARWFRLAFREAELAKDVDAQSWLDQVADAVWNALQESDFNAEIASTYQNLVGPGNGVITCEALSEDEWKGLDFTGVPLREAYPELDSKGEVDAFFRPLSWTPLQIVDKFGEKCPAEIRAKATAGDQTRIDVVFSIYERPEREKALEEIRKRNAERRKARAKGAKDVAPDDLAYPLAPEMRPVGFVHFLLESGEQLGDEGGYYEMPVFHSPFEATAGSAWGFGPGVVCIPTAKYLNAILELKAAALAKVVDPPSLETERGLLSDLDMRPGGRTVVRDIEKSMKPYESGARFDVAHQEATELRAMIRQLFHVDELQLKESPAMTATEVQVRYELMTRVLGSTISRLEASLLGPIIKTAIGHLGRAGQLPEAPASVKEKDPDLNIQYQGPLSRAQRTDEVASIERTASFVAALMKMQLTDAADVFNVEQSVRLVAERLGCPAALLRSESDVKKIRDQRAALQQRMAQAEAHRAEGEAAQQHADAATAAAGGAVGPVTSMPAQPMPVVAPTLPGAA